MWWAWVNAWVADVSEAAERAAPGPMQCLHSALRFHNKPSGQPRSEGTRSAADHICTAYTHPRPPREWARAASRAQARSIEDPVAIAEGESGV